MSTIEAIYAREVLDSRGTPTVEAEVVLASGARGSAIVPSGASTGSHEALEKRDGGNRYSGKGVLKAVEAIHKVIAPELKGQEAGEQRLIDRLLCDLDGTPNKSRLGANAILAVSMAVARARACELGVPLWFYLGGVQARLLPVPLANLINGGRHADNNLDLQEFMIVPWGFNAFREALQAGVEVFAHLKNLLKQRNLPTAVGDEGGFAPSLKSHEEALDLLVEAITRAGYKPGEEIALALDAAATEFYNPRTRLYELSGQGIALTAEQLVQMYERLASRYPIVSLEDGMAEDDMEGWKLLTEVLGKRLQLVGDDLFVTQKARILAGIEEGIANAVLVKLNQVGTLSETLESIEIAHARGYRTIISHRSGESEDPFIAHLAVAAGSGQIKTGSFSRSERLAKYNELLRIEEALKGTAIYAGRTAFPQTRS